MAVLGFANTLYKDHFMKLHVKQNMDHFIKEMFADILRAQSRMQSGLEYEGLFQIVAAELRAAKYCWDELFTKADDPSDKISANGHEIQLRDLIAALMHAANILVETEHMIEQGYPFNSTETVLDATLRETREAFEEFTDLITNLLQSREMYQRNGPLKDFFSLWDGGRHMRAFETH